MGNNLHAAESGVALDVVVDSAELVADDCEPLEVGAHREILRHPHAAMQLYRALTDKSSAVIDRRFRC